VNQSKNNRSRHPLAPEGSSLAYVGLATLSLISCVAVSAAPVGVGHAHTASRTAPIAGLTNLDPHNVARGTSPRHRMPMSVREAEYVSNAPSHGDRFGFKF
jgi:hypothetical protein